jgi:DNA-binding SARP family transcriptional activator
VLRGGLVELAPAAEVTTDVERLERGDDTAYGGELLPDERYEQWTLGPRARLRERRLALLRSEARWEEVLREDPADEEAHRALMRRHVAGGDRPAAARRFRLLATSSRGSGRSPPRRHSRSSASSRAAARRWSATWRRASPCSTAPSSSTRRSPWPRSPASR